ncbi:hypothetical protein [Nocardioides hwasunensis]|uniref:Mce-associated membrane protein n=1 Tax=Nocardioides hwasunensis TaxID=397258 RepID=A0ABR8MBT6_9ACTN|nr:hypothetical protein [Nocardioides hwasunensis]MBD3913610.1 hypothetical protein [Nocardioides hwasunensis]
MTQKRVAAALVVLVLAAAATLGWLVLDGGDTTPTATSAAAADSAVASGAIRNEVREVAAQAAGAVYGYSWKTITDDKASARALMTPDMQRRYERTMAGVVTSSTRDHTVVRAEVLDSALVTATTTHARVLVFVNQSTTDDTLDKPLLDLDRVLVTLARDGDGWRVSELDAL